MKTKQLLLCAVVGATFAACSAEEDLVNPMDGAVSADLTIRPVVGSDFTIGNGEAMSRMAIGTGVRPVFETADALGAGVIDAPTYKTAAEYASQLQTANGDASKLYTIEDWYGCNNAYTTADGGLTWAADQAMVEGNYLFYAPYNESLSLRSPMSVVVPRVQDASTDKKALETYYADVNNVSMVGYKFITGTEKKKPSVALYNVFAYPQFVIKNNFDGYLFNATGANTEPAKAWKGTIKVDSIQLVNVDASRTAIQSQIGGLLSHSKVKTALGTGGNWTDAKKLLNAETTDLLDATDGIVKANRHNQLGVITTLKVGRTIEYGAEINVACVMPAMNFNFTNDQLLAKLYLTVDGIQYVLYDKAKFTQLSQYQTKTKLNAALGNTELGYAFDAKGEVGLSTLSLVAGQRYAGEAISVKNGEYTLKPESGRQLLNIELKGGKATTGTPGNVQVLVRTTAQTGTGVASTADMITMIENAANGTAWAEGVSTTTTKGFSILPVNTVTINAALIDALSDANNNNGGSFAISTVVPVANDVTVVGITGTNVTFKSVNNKTYTIKLTGAVSTPTNSKEYVILTSTPITPANLANDVVIWAGTTAGTIISSANLTITSLHTAKIMNNAPTPANTIAALTIQQTAGVLKIANAMNASTLNLNSAVNGLEVTSLENNGAMTMDGAKFNTAKTSLKNAGTITVASNSKFNVNSGSGYVNVNYAAIASEIGFADLTQQYVKMVLTAELNTTVIDQIALRGYYDAIDAVNVKLLPTDIAKFGDVKTLNITGNIDFKNGNAAGTYDLTGFTIKLNGNSTWTGYNSAQTIVTGAVVNLNQNTLTLTNISVAGSTTGKGTITADGLASKWNSGAGYTIQ